MQLRQLFDDDSGVSPVIGVILMVAITVILAAVIGAFVLGFGGSSASAPTATWDTSQEGTSPITVTFTAQSVSDSFDSGTLEVDGNQVYEGTISANSEIEVELTSGDGDLGQGDSIDLVWSEDGSSSTIATHVLSDVDGTDYSVDADAGSLSDSGDGGDSSTDS